MPSNGTPSLLEKGPVLVVKPRAEGWSTKGIVLLVAATAAVSFQLGAISNTRKPELSIPPTTLHRHPSSRPLHDIPSPVNQTHLEPCNPYSEPGFWDVKTNRWTLYSTLMNSTYTSTLPNRKRQIPTTCSSPNTPPSDPITALIRGNLSSLTYLNDAFIILAGDSQARNTVDQFCRLAHPHLLPQKTLPYSEARIAFWNGTFRTGPFEKYKSLGPHYFYPHICRLDALNLTIMNYFHPGIRWTKGQDGSVFIEEGHTTDPRQRIFELLIPFLERVNLTGPGGIHPSGPTLISANSLLWDIRGAMQAKLVLNLTTVQAHIGAWMHKCRFDFLNSLAEAFPTAEIVWNTMPYGTNRSRYGVAEMAILNGAGMAVAKEVGIE
ncbi:hypothetical protein HK097_002592, partial [Rhizophlyctis rosea]